MNKPCLQCRAMVLGSGCPTCQPEKARIAELEAEVYALAMNLRCIQGMNDVEKIRSYIATILGDRRNG